MTVKSREETLDDLVGIFTPDDLRWLGEQLLRLSDEDILPKSATLDEAVELYLADKCSLGRAAELAGLTRWHIMDVLYERGIPTNGNHDFTPNEYERMFDVMEDLLHADHQ